MNSGQTCIAPDYVLVEQAVADELITKIVANIARVSVRTRRSAHRQ